MLKMSGNDFKIISRIRHEVSKDLADYLEERIEQGAKPRVILNSLRDAFLIVQTEKEKLFEKKLTGIVKKEKKNKKS